ncbi:MAG: PAS domain S-box protein [Coriobacteriia bacterium]|nr:PAS domain S-box protein [Coriobacteriia bacterium]
MKHMQAVRVALVYAVVAVAWLLFSDSALVFLGLSADQVALYSLVKGLGFVAVTGIALFLVIDRLLGRLSTREREYRLLFEHNPEAMWVYDLESLAFLAVNEAAVAAYGYSRDEFCRMTIADIRPAEDVPRLHENVEAVRRGDRDPVDRAGVWRHRTRSGELRWVEVTSYVTRFEGRLAEFVIARDVTAAVEARAEREHTERMKGEFIQTVSHELRTPLTSIMGFSELLDRLSPGQVAEQAPVIVERLRENAARMHVLVEELLEVNDIAVDGITLAPRAVDLGAVVLRAAESVFRGPGHPLTVDIPPDLPLVVCDAERMARVVTNLVSNAVKYSPDGGGVAVSVRTDGDDAVISVADHGIGISPELMDRLFTIFGQADMSSTREFGGLGLGLYIASRIVQAHGGRIDVTSTPGESSTFTVKVPIGEPPGTPQNLHI